MGEGSPIHLKSIKKGDGNLIIAIVIITLLIVIGVGVSSYNKLIRLKRNIDEARSSIDVQMKKKANVIPNLVDVIKMQQNFESSTLEKLVQARSGLVSGSFEDRMKADISTSNLFRMVSEAYPQLGTNSSYVGLMNTIKDIEEKISYSRNRYNIAVTTYNTAQQTIPTMFFAKMANCQIEKVYEMDKIEFDYADNMRINQL